MQPGVQCAMKVGVWGGCRCSARAVFTQQRAYMCEQGPRPAETSFGKRLVKHTVPLFASAYFPPAKVQLLPQFHTDEEKADVKIILI